MNPDNRYIKERSYIDNYFGHRMKSYYPIKASDNKDVNTSFPLLLRSCCRSFYCLDWNVITLIYKTQRFLCVCSKLWKLIKYIKLVICLCLCKYYMKLWHHMSAFIFTYFLPILSLIKIICIFSCKKEILKYNILLLIFSLMWYCDL